MPVAQKNHIINPKVIFEEMRKRLPHHTIERQAADCVAAVLDFAGAELLERCGNAARIKEGKVDGVTIHPEHIEEVLDETELGDLY